ncbi:hypothetical protein [Pseudonocardia alaniniphila]|uniref:DUF4115 domain-containing protein n=1 Tax=Pseudonocardia alaniniphila TaxID=75291 RepID=A0ABS9T9R6_9PSEU|nr:hypothetical protein [Pseudonocardia alaniniphila]MCH6165236.1 hypothetical protein [Pseudonocardia alaniniphila]
MASARRTRAWGWWIGGGGALVIVLVIAILAVTTSRPSAAGASSASRMDTNAALVATTAGEANGAPVDGVEANSTEQLVFHIHAHLQIYVNGQQKLVPYGVGIVPPYQLESSQNGPFVDAGSAIYWLHTHDETGVIHVESPVQRTFTLGDFFDVWHQPLGPNQVGSLTGPVTAFVNGKQVNGDPRAIPLDAHALIQLDVGGPVVPPQPYTFPAGL